MDCVLPLSDCTVSMNARLRNKTKHQNLPQNAEEITLPEQALEVPRGYGRELRPETLNALNSAVDRLNSQRAQEVKTTSSISSTKE